MSTGRWVGSYERISQFRVDRDGVTADIVRKVDRQFEDNSAVHRSMGLGRLERYTDEDRSASQFARKEREDWLRLLGDLRAGHVSHLMVWLFDRAFRTTEDAEALLAACRKGRALIVQTAGNPTVADPHNPDDIFRLKLAGLLAEYEIAKLSMRQRRAQQTIAEKGQFHGGNRTFGYLPGMAGKHPTEAPLVERIVDQVLAGASLYSQAEWLNGMGVTGTKGGKWYPGNFGKFLTLPALAGLREHKAADGTVQTYPAAWPALITEAQHEQLKGLLGNPKRRASMVATNVRKRRFTALVKCGKCGANLKSAPRTDKRTGEKVQRYRCGNWCVTRSVADVDDTVLGLCAEYLTTLRPDGMLTGPQHEAALGQLVARQQALKANVKRYDTDYKAGLIDARLRLESIAEAEAELLTIATAKAELLKPHKVLDGLAGEANARELLDALPWDRLRTVVDQLATFYLDQGPHKGAPFTPDLVRPDWKMGTHAA